MLNKVPQVTLFFWVIKNMATTVGKTAADFLNTNLNLGLTNTSILMGHCCSQRWPASFARIATYHESTGYQWC